MNDFQQEPIAEAVNVLTREYMLIDLHAKTYTGKRKDKDKSAKVNADAGAKVAAAKVEVELFAGCDAEISAINNAIGGLRQMFYSMTLPWSLDDRRREGARLIANSKLFDFIAQYREAQREILAKLDALEAVWPLRVQQAQANLQGLYNPDLYPTFAEVRQKWGLRITYNPVPDATDFNRLSLPGEVATKLAAKVKQDTDVMVNAAMRDAYERTLELVQRLANGTRIKDDGKKGKVYESTVDAINDMIDNLRHFNITDDQSLEGIRLRMEKMMQGIDVKELRDNESARDFVHTESQSIAEDMVANMAALAA